MGSVISVWIFTIFHVEHQDKGNPPRSLAPPELSGARLPRLLFESVMNGARKCVSVLGANGGQVACISEFHPAKTGPCFKSNTAVLSRPWLHARPSRQQGEFPEESDPFLLPTFLSVCFLAYLFSVVHSPYAKHIDCDKALENTHLGSLHPCACA